MNALKQGFQEVLSLETLQMFDEKEVEVKNTKKNIQFSFFFHIIFFQLLISGLGEINVNDWRTYTMYKGGYTPDNPVIQNFWKVINKH